jgi:small-conductance mechanosensitive channel
MNPVTPLAPNDAQTLIGAAWILAAAVIGVALQRLLYWVLRRWAHVHHSAFAEAVVRRTGRAAAYVVPLLAILIVVPELVLPAPAKHVIEHAAGLLAIAAIAWSISALIGLWHDVALAGNRVDGEDDLQMRQRETRVAILGRVANTLVCIVAIGMILTTFPEIRTLGTTLLASAGVVGIVVGLAARPVFENLVAGIQLAFTQPIRIGDVVVVEKQQGRIEEIHTTYVVVQLSELRRLIVPLTYFIEKPFENWTRRTLNVIGEVTFFADFTLDVEALRTALPALLERSPLGAGAFAGLQVIDATDRAMQLRVLVNARNADELAELRFFAREAILAYLREEEPHALPQLRLDAPTPGERPAPE